MFVEFVGITFAVAQKKKGEEKSQNRNQSCTFPKQAEQAERKHTDPEDIHMQA